jgi:hypothetical protein
MLSSHPHPSGLTQKLYENLAQIQAHNCCHFNLAQVKQSGPSNCINSGFLSLQLNWHHLAPCHLSSPLMLALGPYLIAPLSCSFSHWYAWLAYPPITLSEYLWYQSPQITHSEHGPNMLPHAKTMSCLYFSLTASHLVHGICKMRGVQSIQGMFPDHPEHPECPQMPPRCYRWGDREDTWYKFRLVRVKIIAKSSHWSTSPKVKPVQLAWLDGAVSRVQVTMELSKQIKAMKEDEWDKAHGEIWEQNQVSLPVICIQHNLFIQVTMPHL